MDGLKAVLPNSWEYAELGPSVMASVNPIREVVSCMISGLRCAPYLVHNPNADIVEVAFHEVEKVTNMDTHSCVRTSDEALERWVAKQLLIEESETGNPVPDGLTVLAYLIDHPQHAAQRGRHITRKGSLQSAFTFYLSVYIYDAYRIGVEDGFLVPLYGLGASREDVIMSMVQAERRLADFTAEDVNFDITETLRLSIDSLRGGGGTITVPIEYAEAYIYTDLNKVEMVPAGQRDGQGAITFADAPTGKHHRRAGRLRLGVIIAPLRCDRTRRAREIPGRATPLRVPGPKERVPKGTRTRAKVTKLTNSKVVTRVTSRRAKAANTASSTAVADPPGRERRRATTSPTLAARDTRAHKPLPFRILVPCTQHSQWGASCSSLWLA